MLEFRREKSPVVTYECSTNKIKDNFVTFIHWEEVCVFPVSYTHLTLPTT